MRRDENSSLRVSTAVSDQTTTSGPLFAVAAAAVVEVVEVVVPRFAHFCFFVPNAGEI